MHIATFVGLRDELQKIAVSDGLRKTASVRPLSAFSKSVLTAKKAKPIGGLAYAMGSGGKSPRQMVKSFDLPRKEQVERFGNAIANSNK